MNTIYKSFWFVYSNSHKCKIILSYIHTLRYIQVRAHGHMKALKLSNAQQGIATKLWNIWQLQENSYLHNFYCHHSSVIIFNQHRECLYQAVWFLHNFLVGLHYSSRIWYIWHGHHSKFVQMNSFKTVNDILFWYIMYFNRKSETQKIYHHYPCHIFENNHILFSFKVESVQWHNVKILTE